MESLHIKGEGCKLTFRKIKWGFGNDSIVFNRVSIEIEFAFNMVKLDEELLMTLKKTVQDVIYI